MKKLLLPLAIVALASIASPAFADSTIEYFLGSKTNSNFSQYSAFAAKLTIASRTAWCIRIQALTLLTEQEGNALISIEDAKKMVNAGKILLALKTTTQSQADVIEQQITINKDLALKGMIYRTQNREQFYFSKPGIQADNCAEFAREDFYALISAIEEALAVVEEKR